MNKINKMVNLILSGDKSINVCNIVRYINKQQKESSNETNHSKNNS